MMFKKNKEKIAIIFILILSFLVFGQWCYRYLSNKDKEIRELETGLGPEIRHFEYEVFEFEYKIIKNVPEIARKDFLLFLKQLDIDILEIFEKKEVSRHCLEGSIKILKKQGIWDELTVEPDVDFEQYYSSLKDSHKAFQLRLDELLKKVKKEEDLESFRKELEKLREERKKYIDTLAKFAQRIKEELKEPMPFFARWIGLGISIAICLLVSFIISLKISDKNLLVVLPILFFIISLSSHLLIFPLINCLLSLKISSFKETYKHYYYNKFKIFSLFGSPIALLIICCVSIVCTKICVQKLK